MQGLFPAAISWLFLKTSLKRASKFRIERGLRVSGNSFGALFKFEVEGTRCSVFTWLMSGAGLAVLAFNFSFEPKFILFLQPETLLCYSSDLAYGQF